MSEWSELAERLVELDFAIEDIESWATTPEDIEQLKQLEGLRDELLYAMAFHHMPKRLFRRLQDSQYTHSSCGAAVDPRD